MTYKSLLLSSSLIFSSILFQADTAWSSNAGNCAANCNERSCQANPKLAANCKTWCGGLPQYQNRLQTCAKYATGVQAQPQIAAPTLPKPATPSQPSSAAPPQPSSAAPPQPSPAVPSQPIPAVPPQPSPTPPPVPGPQQVPVPPAVIPQTPQNSPGSTSDPALADKLAKKKAKIAALKAQINNLLAQLRSGGNGNVPASPEMEKKVSDFKAAYGSGAIPLRSTGSGGKGPVLQLMEEIDNANDKQAAENLIDYLEAELGSSDPVRAESVIAIFDSSLPEIIKKIQESRARKQTEDKIKVIIDEGGAVEATETANITTAVSTVPITQINPASLLLLFPSDKFTGINSALVNEFSSYFKSLSVDQRKAILKKLSTVVGGQARAISEPGNSRQTIFSLIYNSLSQTGRFTPPTRLPDRIKLEGLNNQLIRLSGNTVTVVADPAIPRTSPSTVIPPSSFPSATTTPPSPRITRPTASPPPPPPGGLGTGTGAPPPPPPPGGSGTGTGAPAAAGTLAAMVPVIPTDGAGPGRTITATDQTTIRNDGLQISGDLRPLGYTIAQSNAIVAYMTARKGITAKTAVNTLIANNNRLFVGTAIRPGT